MALPAWITVDRDDYKKKGPIASQRAKDHQKRDQAKTEKPCRAEYAEFSNNTTTYLTAYEEKKFLPPDADYFTFRSDYKYTTALRVITYRITLGAASPVTWISGTDGAAATTSYQPMDKQITIASGDKGKVANLKVEIKSDVHLGGSVESQGNGSICSTKENI